MPNKTIDALAFCPFYVTENQYSITCEGIMGTYTTTRFASERQKERHEEKYCTKKLCRDCGVYGAVMKKYEPEMPKNNTVIRH